MRRGKTGRYSETVLGGEVVRAFVPDPLPPVPPIDLTGDLQRQLEMAHLALGRLDSTVALLPSADLLLYAYVRKEAVWSSQIEGTQASLSDLLLYEIEQAPGAPLDDVVEVSNYVAALQHGLARLRAGFPLSNRLIREVHGKLLARGRGNRKEPGEFRRSQNWIGGTRPGNAVFVPPPADLLADSLGSLEAFLHRTGDGLPTLVRAALAHVQFETIHPFLDGNGRVGRLLITLLLSHAGVLREPVLYLSLFFKRHRQEYYRLLDVVRRDGDWEAWLGFFLEAVLVTANSAIDAAQRLSALFAADREVIRSAGRKAASMLRVHEALQQRPIARLSDVARHTGLSFPTVGAAMQELVGLGIADELTGRRRNRVFAYRSLLAVLNEGTEGA